MYGMHTMVVRIRVPSTLTLPCCVNASAVSSNLPQLSYIPWIEVLIQCCRQSVFVSLLETGLASFLMENYSLIASRNLDRFSRLVVPADFALILLYNMLVATSSTGYIFGSEPNNFEAFESRLQTLNVLTWVNMTLLIVSGAVFSCYSYTKLRSSMMRDPVSAYSKMLGVWEGTPEQLPANDPDLERVVLPGPAKFSSRVYALYPPSIA